MKNIEIHASRNYSIYIGRNILKESGSFIANVQQPSTACIVTDDIVDRYYSETVEKSLEQAGFSVIKFVFQHGEQSKNIHTYTSILEFLAFNNVTRKDVVIALGGGVTGDMAGFAASTYLRGIKVVQIPTTFLSAIDSSVGGKTAINLNSGKNLAGTFYQPSLVLCDLDTFDTLPQPIFSDGCAEAIKYAILKDRSLFERLLNENINDYIEEIVCRCITIKRDLVIKDEFDNGERQLLNLGHTFGHAIEKCSDFTISHGQAVGIGLLMATRVSKHLGILQEDFIQNLKKCLEKYKLSVHTDILASELSASALHDKKRVSNGINFVLPIQIGKSMLHKIDVNDIETIFHVALNEDDYGRIN